MSHRQMNWEGILASAGYRVTRQRGLILDAVCAGAGHTPFSDVYGRVRRADATIDRSTVYRALHLFVALGIVVAADTGGPETTYEIRKPQPHHHLVCRDCGGEWEIGDAALRALTHEMRHGHDFAVEMDHLVLFGRCARCRDAEAPRQSE